MLGIIKNQLDILLEVQVNGLKIEWRVLMQAEVACIPLGMPYLPGLCARRNKAASEVQLKG